MKPEVYRSRLAYVLGWVWLVFAAANAVDLIVRGTWPSALVAGAVLGAITAVIHLTCLRPGIIARAEGVEVRNPLRTAFIPWAAVDGVRVAHAICIESGGRVVRCWTPQSSSRERIQSMRRATAGRRGLFPFPEPPRPAAEQAAAEAMAGRTHADWVAERLTEAAVTRKGTSAGEFRVVWSPSALAVLGAALTLAAVAFVVS